jgi:HK97 gp10 family phage protein
MSIRVRGVQETIRKLKEFGQQGETRIDQVSGVAANEIATKAAILAPGNFGTLRQSINANKISSGRWKVSVNVFYAAYVEFGTGTFVEVASEWRDIAWAYYVNGKGYMRPQPYLYPAYVSGIRQYKIDLNDALNDLIRRFNS